METPYEDNKYYHSDCLVLLKVLGNKDSETYKIEGLAKMWIVCKGVHDYSLAVEVLWAIGRFT